MSHSNQVRLLAVCLLLSPLAARAQEPDPFASARVHIGPFAVNPTLEIKDVGVDTNVFNDWQNPQSDFTATVAPGADTWLRLGRARLNVKTSLSYLYFAQYASQRGLGTTDSMRLELRLARLRPWVGAGYMTMRQRPGFEIDERVRLTQWSYSAGVDVPLSTRTTFGGAWRQQRTRYEQGQLYTGYSLAQELNRTTSIASGSVRYRLTPLTAAVLAIESVRERFEFSTIRDSNGFRLVPGLEFAATALLTGSAHVGFRHLRMLTPGMPDYNGLVADVDLGYALMGVTRFAVRVSRDVEYSFDPAEPFYVLTGVTGSVSQAIGGPWSVTGRVGVQRLAYRGHAGAGGQEDRTDTVHSYGGALGYKLGAYTRLSVNVDYYTRSSVVTDLTYTGLRIGSSVTYGF